MSRDTPSQPQRRHHRSGSTTRQANTARSGVELLPGHFQTKLIKPAERGEVRASEGSVMHVEVFRMVGVRTSILGRPRPPSRHRPAQISGQRTTPSSGKSLFTGVPPRDTIRPIPLEVENGDSPRPPIDKSATRNGSDMKLNRWKILRPTSLAFCALLALGPGSASVAAADPPTREPISLPTEPFIFTDTLGNNPCGFPVQVAITTNKEIVTTFTRRSGVTSIHTTGALKVTLMNTDTGESIDRNISGPILATVNSDGSTTQTGAGLALWVFDPGVAPDLPRLAIVKGQTVSVLGPGTAFRFISRTGSYEDICATLAA